MEENNLKKPGGKKRFNFYWIYVILTAILLFLYFSGKDETPKEDLNRKVIIRIQGKQSSR